MANLTNRTRSLTEADHLHLRAAEGWLELGNPMEAEQELQFLKPENRDLPQVRRLRYYAAVEKWEILVETCESLCRDYPLISLCHVNLALCLFELVRTQEAFSQLAPGPDHYADKWVIPYNLACYRARSGQLSQAFSWLERASDLAGPEDIREMALDDPDLKPIWEVIRALGDSEETEPADEVTAWVSR